MIKGNFYSMQQLIRAQSRGNALKTLMSNMKLDKIRNETIKVNFQQKENKNKEKRLFRTCIMRKEENVAEGNN